MKYILSEEEYKELTKWKEEALKWKNKLRQNCPNCSLFGSSTTEINSKLYTNRGGSYYRELQCPICERKM